MRWDFLPDGYKTPTDGPLVITARAETVASKSAFREAIRATRCILPASGYYEWQTGAEGAKRPWHFTREDAAPLAFAGLWHRWRAIDACAIISTKAGPGMVGLHNCDPVTLEASDWPFRWERRTWRRSC